jgi:hypothetical protein
MRIDGSLTWIDGIMTRIDGFWTWIDGIELGSMELNLDRWILQYRWMFDGMVRGMVLFPRRQLQQKMGVII